MGETEITICPICRLPEQSPGCSGTFGNGKPRHPVYNADAINALLTRQAKEFHRSFEKLSLRIVALENNHPKTKSISDYSIPELLTELDRKYQELENRDYD